MELIISFIFILAFNAKFLHTLPQIDDDNVDRISSTTSHYRMNAYDITMATSELPRTSSFQFNGTHYTNSESAPSRRKIGAVSETETSFDKEESQSTTKGYSVDYEADKYTVSLLSNHNSKSTTEAITEMTTEEETTETTFESSTESTVTTSTIWTTTAIPDTTVTTIRADHMTVVAEESDSLLGNEKIDDSSSKNLGKLKKVTTSPKLMNKEDQEVSESKESKKSILKSPIKTSRPRVMLSNKSSLEVKPNASDVRFGSDFASTEESIPFTKDTKVLPTETHLTVSQSSPYIISALPVEHNTTDAIIASNSETLLEPEVTTVSQYSSTIYQLHMNYTTPTSSTPNFTHFDYRKFNTRPGSGDTTPTPIVTKPPRFNSHKADIEGITATAMVIGLIILTALTVFGITAGVYGIRWHRRQRDAEGSTSLMMGRRGPRRGYPYYDTTMC